MTQFDPLRAAREELTGLTDVLRTLHQRERKNEEDLAMTESELNATRKIIGFVRIAMDSIQARIAALEQER